MAYSIPETHKESYEEIQSRTTSTLGQQDYWPTAPHAEPQEHRPVHRDDATSIREYYCSTLTLAIFREGRTISVETRGTSPSSPTHYSTSLTDKTKTGPPSSFVAQ